MRAGKRTTTWLLILIWVIPGLAFGAARARLVGRVVDPQGKPIPGVVVTATSPQIPTFKEVRTTDKKGTFIIDFHQVDVTYRYRFDKPGYEILEAQQEWHLEGTQHYEWTLSPGGTQRAVVAFNEGVAALRAKELATAEAKFADAVRYDPALAAAWRALSLVHLQAGHDKAAAEAAEKAVALGSRDEAVLRARWQAYRNLKDEAKAAQALRDLESVARLGEDAKRIHNEAVALTKAGNDSGAFAKFQEALKVDPNLEPALLGLATVGLKIGRYAEAATAAEAVLKADPKDEQAIRLRYNASLNLGDKQRLFDALVGLAAVEPAAASKGLMTLASEAYDAKDWAGARVRFLKILEIDPNQPLIHYYLGMVYVEEGATAEARSQLERYLALAPNGPEADVARAVLKRLGRV